MAVDTREKRFSMMALASGLDGANVHNLFEADGSVDTDDRAHMFDTYGGIVFGNPVAIVLGIFKPLFRPRRRI